MRAPLEYEVLKFKKNRRIVGINVIKNALSLKQSDIDLFYSLKESNTAYCPVERKFKSNGEKRQVYNPHEHVRLIQDRINSHLFNPKGKVRGIIKWPFYLYGSIPNFYDENDDLVVKNYIECAKETAIKKQLHSQQLFIRKTNAKIHRVLSLCSLNKLAQLCLGAFERINPLHLVSFDQF